MLRGSSKTEAD